MRCMYSYVVEGSIVGYGAWIKAAIRGRESGALARDKRASIMAVWTSEQSIQFTACVLKLGLHDWYQYGIFYYQLQANIGMIDGKNAWGPGIEHVNTTRYRTALS